MIRTRPLGGTGIELSVVTLGGATFGGLGTDPAMYGKGLSREESLGLLDAAAAAGVTSFDTADSYTAGESERCIGAWLAADRARAASLVVATKTGVTLPYPSVDLRPERVVAAARSSIERLGVERIDLYQTHQADPATPLEATLEALAGLVDAGVVAHLGACNVDVAQLEAFLATAERLDLPRIEWVQNRHNLLHRVDDGGVLRACADHGLGYLAHTVLAGGILSGKYAAGQAPAPGSRASLKPEVYGRYLTPEVHAGIDALTAEARHRDVPVATLAQAWVLADPRVTSIIVGAQHPAHLDAAVDALDVELDADERDRLTAMIAGT